MSRWIRFGQLEQVLNDLGFRKRIVPRKAVIYDRLDDTLMLIVSLHRANEFVPDYVLAYIRQQLDVFGIAERADFEGMLLAVAA